MAESPQRVLLIEKATILVISHAQRNQHRDVQRFEISNIIKQFKLSCSKLVANFQSKEVRNSSFASFTVFTANTYVMVVLSDSEIPSEAILMNIRMRRNILRNWTKIINCNGAKTLTF